MKNNNEFKHLMRLGIHAEQKYFKNRPELYDILVLNGNIAEYFAKGTATFLMDPQMIGRPFFIDPITHSYGHNPMYIMAYDDDRQPKGVKKSLMDVARVYGDPVVKFVGERPLEPTDFSDSKLVEEFTSRVVDFQRNRLLQAIMEDQKYFDQLPKLEPIFLIAPYFYMDSNNLRDWLPVNVNFVKIAKKINPSSKIFCEIVIDREILDETEEWEEIAKTYSEIDECDGYLLWISEFSEHQASKPQLQNLRSFISSLSKTERPIYNLYGGYYSILLSKYGLTGVCHGPGYGEDRHVIPVGGGIPRPKFYLNPVHRRLLYSEVQFIIKNGAWESIDEFHKEVCDGEKCHAVLEGDLENFVKFGKVEARQRSDGRYYNVPLPETIENMNFHYLESKDEEFSQVKSSNIKDLTKQLNDSHDRFRGILTKKQSRHLKIWVKALLE